MMVKRKPIKPKYKGQYTISQFEDNTDTYYNRKQKKTKIKHDETITRKKGKKTYKTRIKFKSDGNYRKVNIKHKLKTLTKNDKYLGVQNKYRLTDGGIKKQYKNMDMIETTTIYERQPKTSWQICANVKYKKDGKIFNKFVYSEIEDNEDITYSKVKQKLLELMIEVEKYYNPISMKPFIRYYDFLGGTGISQHRDRRRKFK